MLEWIVTQINESKIEITGIPALIIMGAVLIIVGLNIYHLFVGK